MRIRFTALLLVIALSACSPLKQRHEIEQNPDLKFVMLQSSQMFDVIADQTLTVDQKERILVEKFDAGMARWKSTKSYGRLYNADDFSTKPGALYAAIVNFYNGQNEIGKTIPYYEMAAQEALDNDLYGVYLQYQHFTHSATIKLGNFEKAHFILQQTSEKMSEYFAVDPSLPPENYDIYSLYYYQYINDLSLSAQLKSGQEIDLAPLSASFKYRQQAQQLFPALSRMMLNTPGYEVKTMGGVKTRYDYTELSDELRDYLLAFAKAGDQQTAEQILEKLKGIYTTNINSMEKDANNAYRSMVMKGAMAGGFTVASDEQIENATYAAQRHGARSKVWLHWDQAILSYELNNYKQGYEAILKAQDQFSDVDKIYAHLSQSYLNVDGIDADRQSVMLLQAQLEEQLGKTDQAANRYQDVITWTELARKSMPIEQRKYFFESFAKKAYLGRVRALVASYQANQSSIDQLVRATESFRARQLKELLDRELDIDQSVADIQSSMDKSKGIIAFTDLDSHLLTLWINSGEVKIHYIAKPDQWDGNIKELRKGLVEEQRYDINDYRLISDTLFGEMSSDIQKTQRIFLVTDGSLSLLPLNILPVGRQLLQTNRAISYLPSITMFNNGKNTIKGDKTLFALGDPVYSPESRITNEDKAVLLATRGSSELGGFAALPETRTEVESIAKHFNQTSSVLLGLKASESMLKSTDLSGYSNLHFATHGVIEGDIPELTEPALVLAYEDGEDGFLTATEVSSLNLNADITVLSACNTGSGEYFRGEGVMGLGRAFMVAGSRNVVVSLWPVDSLSTELLMVQFYKALNQGHDAATALSKAQSQLQNMKVNASSDDIRGLKRSNRQTNEGYRNPYYWSPFILISAS